MSNKQNDIFYEHQQENKSIYQIAKESGNPTPINSKERCKHGVLGICTKCEYQNTGRRKSTDAFVESDVVDFMGASINKRLNEII